MFVHTNGKHRTACMLGFWRRQYWKNVEKFRIECLSWRVIFDGLDLGMTVIGLMHNVDGIL